MIKEDVFGSPHTCDHLNVEYEPATNHVSCEDCGAIFDHTPQTQGDPEDAEEMPDVDLDTTELTYEPVSN